jgi:hypothetical protein
MSDEHKAALRAGRDETRAVRQYLDAVASTKPKRGRKRTPDSIKKRLSSIEQELASASALKALHLRQERIDLQAELTATDATVDITEIEDAFVAAARGYGERKGISYQVWREAGVSAEVLKKAGIGRGAG